MLPNKNINYVWLCYEDIHWIFTDLKYIENKSEFKFYTNHIFTNYKIQKTSYEFVDRNSLLDKNGKIISKSKAMELILMYNLIKVF